MVLNALAPEIFVTGMACIILLEDVCSKNRTGAMAYRLTLLTLIISGALTIFTISMTPNTLFNNSFIVDRFACSLKMVLYVLLAAIFVYSRIYMRERSFFTGEFFSLSLLSLLGMMVVISSGTFLTLYLGLELFVLPLYALIVFVKNQAQYTEAAIKYFIIGSLGSGLLLYGMSLIYGATGTLEFMALANSTNSSNLFILGMVFVICGIALEFGAVPFHMWLPDVYEGSPTTVTMMIGTIPKIAVFAITYRLLTLAFTNITTDWQQLFMLMGLASIVIGNLMSIVQTNIKRFLAYSTINHIGFILLGLFASPTAGFAPAIFYTIVYAFMVLGAFAIIMHMSARGFEADLMTDFTGLNKRDPWLAFLMLIIMFALAGIPPLVGFYAKLQILQGVISAGFAWIAILAMLFSVVGAFYYLRVVRLMYFEDTVAMSPGLSGMSTIGKVLAGGNSLLLLITGIYPASILYLCIAMLQ